MAHSLVLRVIDQVSSAGSATNEDRAAAEGRLAWVIDGATDVLAAPLTNRESDSAWFADELDRELRDYARSGLDDLDLAALPGELARSIAPRFDAASQRRPATRHEHPSAAGLIIALQPDRVAYVALADCSMIARTDGATSRHGIARDDAGDRHLVGVLRTEPDTHKTTGSDLRGRLLPILQASRDLLNEPHGYGAFSVLPPPDVFTMQGSLAARPGTRLLLATDGFMRLVDVFSLYSEEGLMDAAGTLGLAALEAELRGFEQSATGRSRFPRFKCHDDATALLIEVVRA